MYVYTLTFTDYVHSDTMLIGTFSSFENAWNALLSDKDENMSEFENFSTEIDSNPELGIGSYTFAPRDVDSAYNAYYAYAVNVTEMNEALDADHQVEL